MDRPHYEAEAAVAVNEVPAERLALQDGELLAQGQVFEDESVAVEQ